MWNHLKRHHHIDEASAKRKASEITDNASVTTSNTDAISNKRSKRDTQMKLDDVPGSLSGRERQQNISALRG